MHATRRVGISMVSLQASRVCRSNVEPRLRIGNGHLRTDARVPAPCISEKRVWKSEIYKCENWVLAIAILGFSLDFTFAQHLLVWMDRLVDFAPTGGPYRWTAHMTNCAEWYQCPRHRGVIRSDEWFWWGIAPPADEMGSCKHKKWTNIKQIALRTCSGGRPHSRKWNDDV